MGGEPCGGCGRGPAEVEIGREIGELEPGIQLGAGGLERQLWAAGASEPVGMTVSGLDGKDGVPEPVEEMFSLGGVDAGESVQPGQRPFGRGLGGGARHGELSL